MLSDLQKAAAEAIVNVFETGRALGDYAQVTLLAGDPGHLTYGRAQTTLGGGNLHLLIKSYCSMPKAAYAASFAPYLSRLADVDLKLDRDAVFCELLKKAGGDPVMQAAQDGFFDRLYWQPAVIAAAALGFSTALSTAVVYDSLIHGSWSALRDRTTAKHGAPATIGEKPWMTAYVGERRNWLATHPNVLLHKTVYRMDAFAALIRAANWSLGVPLAVCGVTLDREALACRAPAASAPTPPSKEAGARTLRLANPPLSGDDVRALQKALSRKGYTVNIDGIFGGGLDGALKAWQTENGLVADGVAGPATRTILGLG